MRLIPMAKARKSEYFYFDFLLASRRNIAVELGLGLGLGAGMRCDGVDQELLL